MALFQPTGISEDHWIGGRKVRLTIIWLCISVIIMCRVAHEAGAEDLLRYCGNPPPVANEFLKADIDAQASALTRKLIDAGGSVSVEKRVTEIFSKYPDAELSRANAYLQYQICLQLMNDHDMSTNQKIDKLIDVNNKFRNIPAINAAPMTDQNKYFKAVFNSAIEAGNRLNINVTIQNVYGAPFRLSAPFQLVQRSRSAGEAGIANDNIGNIFILQNVIGVSAGRCQRVRFSHEYNIVSDGATQTVIFDLTAENVQRKGTSLNFSTNFCVEVEDNIGSVPVGFSNVPLR